MIDYFEAASIDPARLLPDRAGKTHPTADNETPEGPLKSRAADIG